MVKEDIFSTDLNPVEAQYCECTVEYSAEGIDGYQTKMDYVGAGKFKCPNCGFIEDMSSDVYKVRLEFKKTKGCECCNDGVDCGDESCLPDTLVIDILEPVDQRLLKKWDEDCDGVIKKALEDDLRENVEEFKYHELGIFDVELLYNYYRCSYEYEEYDMNLRIIAEKEVK